MSRWKPWRITRARPLLILRPLRSISTTARLNVPYTEHFQIPCASSGDVVVSLHNIAEHAVSSPLVINIPPFPTENIQDIPSYLPGFLHQYPTASIHYRWAETDGTNTTTSTPTHVSQDTPFPITIQWPTPLHDVLFGYDWLVQRQTPPDLARRKVYVYGSYLGASLASTLALTESHTHYPMAVRGLLAFNGIYNWTTFLPDHPINRLKKLDPFNEQESLVTDKNANTGLHQLKEKVPVLFRNPSNLFDPFASPVLLFYNPGFLAPESFPDSTESSPSPSSPSDIEQLLDYNKDRSSFDTRYYDDFYDELTPPKPSTEEAILGLTDKVQPRKTLLAFPPRQSTLKIPETLLLHHTSPRVNNITEVVGERQRTARKRRQETENNFETQAVELAILMRRSVNMLEFKERRKWDYEFGDSEDEAEHRVAVADVGDAEAEYGLGERGQELASLWLEERM